MIKLSVCIFCLFIPLSYAQAGAILSLKNDVGVITIDNEMPVDSSHDILPIPVEATAPLGVLAEKLPLFDISSDQASNTPNGANRTTIRVAPGETLPISVKLSNFGGGKRVDVLVHYAIYNSIRDEIYSASETVAVETTVSLVKSATIPYGTYPGIHIAKTSITYQGQEFPAVTQFSFMVERKFFGIFQSDFFSYMFIVVIIGVFMFFLGNILVKHRREMRFIPLDYSNIPHNRRTFYEILSDTIMQMSRRVGDDAITIASKVSGLEIDATTGRILNLDGSPAKIIAELVSEYEKLFGKKVSFSFRKEIEPKGSS